MRLIGLLALLALLQGCSSSPLSPTGEAVYYALEKDTHLRLWAEACQGLSPDMRQTALLARQNWWQRNGTFVQGADFGLAYDLVQISDERVETGARLAMALTWNIVASAEADIAERLQSGSQAEAQCRQVLSAYNNGDQDLRGNEPMYEELVSLQRRLQQEGSDLALKRAAVAHSSGKVYGRSFYVVERMGQRQGCAGGEIQLLKNSWPNEVYEARCPDGSYLLVRCEWGNCRFTD